jgi:CBS domain containing-hemolysin-like protein
MNNSILFSILGLLLIDSIIIAARASVQNADYGRLATLGEEKGLKLDRALELVKRRNIVSDSLSLALMLIRFSIAALILSSTLADLSQRNPQNLFSALIFTAFLLWLSEFLIERRIRREPESWMLRLAPIVRFLALILSPILALPVALSKRANGDELPSTTVTEDEIKTMVATGEKEGVLEQDERQMIYSIFQFGDTLAREIMIPRIDMFALDVNTPIDEAAEAVLKSGYSRVPVYEEKIDNILGLLYTKDMLKVWQDQSKYKSLRDLLRPANFIPESKKVDDLLAEMQAEHIHIAIVADEYGGIAGLVTLEDIVEEIVGEIRDEYDQGEESLFQKISDQEYVFHGRIDLDDFNQMLAVSLNTSEADTLGGYIYNQLGRVPRAGESIQLSEVSLKIEQINGRRIRKVRVLKNKVATKKVEEENSDDG